MSERVEALRRAAAAHPEDDTLRLMLAEALDASGDVAAAVSEYEAVLNRSALPAELAVAVGLLAVRAGRLEVAKGCAALARATGVDTDLDVLEARLSSTLDERGLVRVRVDDGASNPGDGGPTHRREELTRFSDIGGMDDVKAVIRRQVLLPLTRADLLRRYGRRSGGGVLLYGPPGCGKTMIARAIAGECALPFVNVRIEDILDPFLGVSERNLHAAFVAAREMAPSVLFLDELDALAYARARQRGAGSRQLVSVLLEELDAIGSDNTGVLILAATNSPWDVDEALQRPGRFDRTIFVPPPDAPARAAILSLFVGRVEGAEVDVGPIAAATDLFSGADLRRLVDDAVDGLIDVALDSGHEPSLRTDAVLARVGRVRPTTLEWLQRAEAYVEFANSTERYDDVAGYLKRAEVRKRRRQR